MQSVEQTMPNNPDRQWLHTAAVAAFLAVYAPHIAVFAQGLENPEAIDTIIGSEVQEEEARTAADPARLIAAIDASIENAAKIRKTAKLDKVGIVRLDAGEKQAPVPEVDAKIKERESEIAALRQELQSNAMLFHAINSRSVLLGDVVAVEFDDANGVTIYAMGTAPATGAAPPAK
jgi:hypothetical protein